MKQTGLFLALLFLFASCSKKSTDGVSGSSEYEKGKEIYTDFRYLTHTANDSLPLDEGTISTIQFYVSAMFELTRVAKSNGVKTENGVLIYDYSEEVIKPYVVKNLEGRVIEFDKRGRRASGFRVQLQDKQGEKVGPPIWFVAESGNGLYVMSPNGVTKDGRNAVKYEGDLYTSSNWAVHLKIKQRSDNSIEVKEYPLDGSKVTGGGSNTRGD